MTFYYRLNNEDGHYIGYAVNTIEADDLGHALQKLAARLPEPDIEVAELEIWRAS